MKYSYVIAIAFVIFIVNIPNEFAYAELSDELETTLNLSGQSQRSIDRFFDVIRICNNQLELLNLSFVATCDSVVQKYYIEIGHFFKENQATIERLIYPYTIPATSESLVGQESSNVTGTTDPTKISNHIQTARQYGDIQQIIAGECDNLLSENNVNGIRDCMTLINSLNGKLKIFNSNAQLEIEKILALGNSANLN
jgi:hypothetical protein